MMLVGSAPTGPSITLHSSWFGIVSALLGTVLLDALAVAAASANGLTVVTVLLVVVGVVATLAVLFDMPIATRFESTGFERRAPLRRQRIGYDQINRLSRMRRVIRRPGDVVRTTGLVAIRGRRQILLVDRSEGLTEHRRLRTVLGTENAELLLAEVDEPPINRTPTWVGRRRRWHPDEPA